jgi:hypothetical protein
VKAKIRAFPHALEASAIPRSYHLSVDARRSWPGRRREQSGLHEGPPSLWKAPGVVVVVPLVCGSGAVLRGVQLVLEANGLGHLLLGLLVSAVGAAILVLMVRYWSGFRWRRKHRE